MADMNWNKINADFTRMVGLVVASVVAGVAAWLMMSIGFAAWLTVVLFFIVWAVLGLLVLSQTGEAAPAAVGGHAAQAQDAHPVAEAVVVEAAPDEPAAEDVAEVVESAPAETEAEAEAEDAADARPPALDAPRGGKADDLKELKGVGPKLEQTLNENGIWHFDQIAAWTEAELAWVDENLDGVRGRASRDEWVSQAAELAKGE